MSDTPALVGDWLGDELDRQGRKRRWLAIEVGVHPETVSRWVDNEAIPDAANCVKIADALGVDRDFLLDLAGHRPDAREPEIDLSDPLISFAAMNQDKLTDAQKRAMIAMAKEFLKGQGYEVSGDEP